MKYNNIKSAVFLSRPNRFIAYILVDGKEELCHVKNTGRCGELLLPGTIVYVQEFDTLKRKTKYDLIAVCKEGMIVNIDSQAPNKVFEEWIKSYNYFGQLSLIKPECTFMNSRFDFYLESATGNKIFVEVKGVTLEDNGLVAFPDAPTQRGLKHVMELCKCVSEGYDAYLFFVVQLERAQLFVPNKTTHPEFADMLVEAQNSGVKIKAVNCEVHSDSIAIKDFVHVNLQGGGRFG